MRVWRAASAGRPADVVLQDVSMAVAPGEFVAIVGPSGCGKSTLLNVISGLQPPDSGEVLLDGERQAMRLGRVAHMHQRDLLLPWRTVLGNARLGLELAGVDAGIANDRARSMGVRFGLGAVMDSYPGTLSGGMRQRAALLRAVLPERPVLLLDEPFGALDAITRADLQNWLAQALDRSDKAVVLVTHDVEEALVLADRVLVMAGPPGRIAAALEVALPRPRPADAVTSPEFIGLKRQLIGLLGQTREDAA